MPPLLREDLDHVLAHTAELWPSFAGQRFFITGGTGFFGTWLLETMIAANARWRLGISAAVLSRDPAQFLARVPHLRSNAALRWVKGGILELTPDLVSSQLGAGSRTDAVIHLVTEADVDAARRDPLTAVRVIAGGTERALEFATGVGARRFLFTSSGSVYGRQPPELERIPETYPGAPDVTDMESGHAAAANAKRYAETLCAAYSRSRGIQNVIARCFAFHGPHLPLTGKFAIGNFIQDVRAGRAVVVKGDGTPVRSYLYAADLAIWLWTLLARGQSGTAYNVGSELPLSIRELAGEVARAAGAAVPIEVLQSPIASRPAERYVPSTRRAREELGLAQRIPRDEALRRTFAWLRTGDA